jgi:membrane protein
MPDPKKMLRLPHHRFNARMRELMEAEEASLSRHWRAVAYFLKLVRETWREIQEKNCTLRASALAYKSLVSLVPVVAVLLAVLSLPTMEKKRDEVMEKLLNNILPVEDSVTIKEAGGAGPAREAEPDESPAAGPPAAPAAPPAPGAKGAEAPGAGAKLRERRTRIKDVFTSEVNKLAKRAGAVGTVGFLVLLGIVLSLMYTVEETFNRIWGVARGRSIVSRVVSYTAVLFWAPILLAASLSVSAFFQIETGRTGQILAHLAFLRPVIVFFMPMIIATAALTALYVILPNTKVRLKPALTGAALAAGLWELAVLGFNLYVKHVVAKNAVYGTLGLIPMIFLWLYVTWLVVLFGSSVSFTVQNYEDLTRKEERRRRGLQYRVYYAIRAAAAVAARFTRGEPGDVAEELSGRLDIPEYAVRESLDVLAAKGLLLPAAGGETDVYVPSRPLEAISVADILAATAGETFRLPPPLPGDAAGARLAALLSGADAQVARELATVTLRDLAADELAAIRGAAATA